MLPLGTRRTCAAFFLFLTVTSGLASTPALAALAPDDSQKNININQNSTERNLKKGGPVKLKRDILPDISEVFGGYSNDELVTEIPTIASPVRKEKTESRVSEDGLVILEFRIGNTILNDALIGYSERSMLLLPIGQVADSLQFLF